VANKVVVIDLGFLCFMAILTFRKTYTIPAGYNYLSMIIARLGIIGIDFDDLIILAKDSREGSWRKNIVSEYKAQRKEAREKQEDKDWWDEMFREINIVSDKINAYTCWHVVELPRMECDDIASVACRTFPNKEVILCLGGSTHIKMSSGRSKFIQHIKPGDEILSYDKKLNKFKNVLVKKTWKIKKTEVVDIYFKNNTQKSIRCGVEHKFYTKNGWKEAKQLSAGDEIFYNGSTYSLHIDKMENTLKFFSIVKPAILRKYPKWNYFANYLCNGKKISKIIIKKSKTRPFILYDIEVESPHTYFADGLLTHNCTSDSDWKMLLSYPNVRLLSTKTKKWVEVPNPEKILKDKIFKGDVADNLKGRPKTELDLENRRTVVNLLELPDYIEQPIKEVLWTLPQKNMVWDRIPFKSLRPRIRKLYGGT
jgi:hypothetical protein